MRRLECFIQRSQLRCLPGISHLELFQAHPTGKRPWSTPQTHWRGFTQPLLQPGNAFGKPRKGWETLLWRGPIWNNICHHDQGTERKDEWMNVRTKWWMIFTFGLCTPTGYEEILPRSEAMFCWTVASLLGLKWQTSPRVKNESGEFRSSSHWSSCQFGQLGLWEVLEKRSASNESQILGNTPWTSDQTAGQSTDQGECSTRWKV